MHWWVMRAMLCVVSVRAENSKTPVIEAIPKTPVIAVIAGIAVRVVRALMKRAFPVTLGGDLLRG